LSIKLYTSILVSNQTPFDLGTMTARQLAGQTVFNGAGRCAQCHAAPRFTSAALNTAALPAVQFVDRPRAFANIAVRPIAEDDGVVASAAAFASIAPGNGRFKTPGLRNVELTGPYFHNGGSATLRQVMDFYERGGDFRTAGITGIVPLVLSAADKDAVVDFMIALTDERVRRDRTAERSEPAGGRHGRRSAGCALPGARSVRALTGQARSSFSSNQFHISATTSVR
jgi:cytochrome c peroxidase